MKLNIGLEFTDEQLRRLRARLGRGGTATRKEIRVWVHGLVGDALRVLPEPKRLRREAPRVEPRPSLEYYTVIKAVPGSTLCTKCGAPKDDHGKTGFTCPRRSGLPPGTRFSCPVRVQVPHAPTE